MNEPCKVGFRLEIEGHRIEVDTYAEGQSVTVIAPGWDGVEMIGEIIRRAAEMGRREDAA